MYDKFSKIYAASSLKSAIVISFIDANSVSTHENVNMLYHFYLLI